MAQLSNSIPNNNKVFDFSYNFTFSTFLEGQIGPTVSLKWTNIIFWACKYVNDDYSSH